MDLECALAMVEVMIGQAQDERYQVAERAEKIVELVAYRTYIEQRIDQRKRGAGSGLRAKAAQG